MIALLVLACAAFAQSQVLPAKPARMEPPSKAGLGADFHAGRRAALVAELRRVHPRGTLLVRGLPDTRGYLKFQQEKVFWYLSGVEGANASLCVDIETGAATLFLSSASAGKEQWEGEQWDASDAWVPAITGIAAVKEAGQLDAHLAARVAIDKVVWISKEPWIDLAGCHDRARPHDAAIKRDPLDGRPSREEALAARLVERHGADVRDCQHIIGELRRVKQPEEATALRRASEVGALAMLEAIRSTRAGVGEWELEAAMSFVHRREGAAGPGYHAIAGCGPNALVLHYNEVRRELRAGEMMLLDYAPEFDKYVSDITRSWPVDGIWTERMIELYDAVLASQEAGIAAVKPGATMRDVEAACRRVLAERGLAELLPHGTCHYVGLEVHDMGDGSKPLEPGVAFTVEPGLYDPESGIGIRIEDVVLVTADGCEVLSKGVPKDRASLSKLVAEEGLLDRLPRRLFPAEGLR